MHILLASFTLKSPKTHCTFLLLLVKAIALQVLIFEDATALLNL